MITRSAFPSRRAIVSDEPCGVLRVYLNDDWAVIGQRTLGRVNNSAMKLSPDDSVEQGLHVAPTIDAGLRAMAGGLRPVWVILGAANLPVLAGVEVTAVGAAGAARI